MFRILLLCTLITSSLAKRVVVNVGGGTKNESTIDPSTIFDPQTIDADVGDTIFFNFTWGDFSVIQSTFAQPCIHAHDTNTSINGFDSGTRATVNGTAITNLEHAVTDNETVWFYEATWCGQGGVGAVNVKADSNETFDGFVRNAERLFGPGANDTGSDNSNSTSSNNSSNTGSSASPSAAPSGSGGSSGAERTLALSIPLACLGLLVVLL